MKISLCKNGSKNNSTFIVFTAKSVTNGKSGDKPVFHCSLKEISNLLQAAVSDKSIRGDAKESVLFRNANVNGYQNVLCIGLGDSKKVTPETLRNMSAESLKQLKSQRLADATVSIESYSKFCKDVARATQATAEGFWLGNYSFDQYKTDKKNDEIKQIEFLPGPKQNPNTLTSALHTAEIISSCVNFSRYLGDTPGNLMTPDKLAKETINAAKGTGLKVTVWDKARIKKEKFGGLLGVSLGSSADPRFIILEYKGAPASKKPIAFVGKGLTFDSGGISIKPSQSMEEMKYDMCGGANVIGTMLAIAKLKLKINACAYIPSTENMPGPSANKPGDILVARNGKTVEVFNTDAEGRLILMDALAYASEQKPAVIFDAATLTGAMVIALSNIYTGVFTRNEKLRGQILKAAETSGELVWPMPISDYHVADMKGTFADLCNISSAKGGGSSTAAAFLEQFVAPDIPWAHFDIAGTAWATGNRLSYCGAKNASGVIIRTFVELAKQYV